MSREKIRLIGIALLIVGGAIAVIALSTSVYWAAIIGGGVALLAIPLVTAVGISAPQAVLDERERLKNQPREPKQLRIKEQKFGAGMHPLTFLFLVCILACPVVCLLWLAGVKATDPLVIGFAALFLALIIIVYSSANARFILDQRGIRVETPFGPARSMNWQDLISLQTRYFRSGVLYEVYSLNSSLSFSANMPDCKRLLACIEAAMDRAPDADGLISVDLPPKDKLTASAVTLAVIGILMFVIGAIFTGIGAGDWQRVNVPLVPLQQVPSMEDGRVVRVQGKLSADEPLSSSNGGKKYAFQEVEIMDHRGKSTRYLYTAWAPKILWLSNGSTKVAVKSSEVYERFLDVNLAKLDNNWEKSETNGKIDAAFRKGIERYSQSPQLDDGLDLAFLAIEQDSPVSVIAMVKHENGQPMLVKDGDYLWLSTKSQDDMLKDVGTFLAGGFAVVALGLIYMIAALFDWLRRKRQLESAHD